MRRKLRHLSRAHRAAIAKGVRRYWRQVARAKARRRTRDRARRELKRIQATQVGKAKALPRRLTEEWEITVRYHPRARNQAIGLTLRVVAPRGTPRDVVLLVAKRAGYDQVEQGFQVHGINWQKLLEGPRSKTYDYGADVETGLQVPGFTGLFSKAQVRAERVAE